MTDLRTPAEKRIEAQEGRIDELESGLRLVISFLEQYKDAARSTIVAATVILSERLPEPEQRKVGPDDDNSRGISEVSDVRRGDHLGEDAEGETDPLGPEPGDAPLREEGAD